jgi:hypothetical protein
VPFVKRRFEPRLEPILVSKGDISHLPVPEKVCPAFPNFL